MNALAMSPATLASMVIALGFAAGLNVYATVFSLGVMARLHWIALPSGLESVANPWIIGASGVLFAMEFFADKIPGFDLIWNAVHTFIRIPVAAVLAYAAGSHLTPEAHLLITCLGAVVATLAHGSKTAVRVAVTPSPEPLSNIALSGAEDVAAIGLTYGALHFALIAAGIAAAIGAAAMVMLWLGWKTLRFGFRRAFLNGEPTRASSPNPA